MLQSTIAGYRQPGRQIPEIQVPYRTLNSSLYSVPQVIHH